MSIEKVDFDAYHALYAEMQNRLAELGDQPDQSTGYRDHLVCVKERIMELNASIRNGFASRDEEMIYFREYWPRFYSKLFYYVLLQRFWVEQQSRPARLLKDLIEEEERKATGYFSGQKDFWANYRGGLPQSSDEFTRACSSANLLDPLSLVLDPNNATTASYRVAWGLAYEQYFEWLRQIGESKPVDAETRWEWKETLSAAAEWIKATVEVQSIYINGKPANAAQLRAQFEKRFDIRLGNFNNLVYAADDRKLEETKYISKLLDGLMGRKKRLRK